MHYKGSVVIAHNELHARCKVCLKEIEYKPMMRLATWDKLLRAFVAQHQHCKGVRKS